MRVRDGLLHFMGTQIGRGLLPEDGFSAAAAAAAAATLCREDLGRGNIYYII